LLLKIPQALLISNVLRLHSNTRKDIDKNFLPSFHLHYGSGANSLRYIGNRQSHDRAFCRSDYNACGPTAERTSHRQDDSPRRSTASSSEQPTYTSSDRSARRM
jgi:hypothetical protein